jgi:hypothetical protein
VHKYYPRSLLNTAKIFENPRKTRSRKWLEVFKKKSLALYRLTCKRLGARAYTRTHAHAHTHRYTHTRARTHPHTHTHTHTHTDTHTHRYTHTDIHTHKHTHTLTHKRARAHTHTILRKGRPGNRSLILGTGRR